MDYTNLITVINGVGFPIFACIIMGVYIMWERKSRNTERETYMKENTKILEEVKDSVDNNTKMIEKLIDLLNTFIVRGVKNE